MRNTAYDSTYPKVAVQCLNQALCFYSSSIMVDPARAGLRNSPPSGSCKTVWVTLNKRHK